jgi:GTPase SAR1 family protein
LLLASDSRSRSSTTTSQTGADQDSRKVIAPSIQAQEYTIKILVIGELGTGKTAIIQRYVKNVFSSYYRNTVCHSSIKFKYQ